jgi:hypothetical protein
LWESFLREISLLEKLIRSIIIMEPLDPLMLEERELFVPPQPRASSSCSHWAIGLAIALVTFLILQCPVFHCSSEWKSDESEIALTCPAVVPASNEVNTSDPYYIDPTREKALNFSDFIQHYRTTTFDAWTKTYEEVLEGMRHWKTTRLVPNVKSGDHVYESACGIGLNLIMTMELLHEHGITNVTLSGNEYLEDSAMLGNRVVDTLASSFGGTKGSICQADSTNLQHIPNNTFDLVFTGYITSLYDPLGWNQTDEENARRNRELCAYNSSSSDYYDISKLLDIAEERQHAWHAIWVDEMIRIAKPGKAVIIAQERRSKCQNRPDFLGRSQQWWRDAVYKYGWDVDTNSLDFEDDQVFSRNVRYNVFMRKNE